MAIELILIAVLAFRKKESGVDEVERKLDSSIASLSSSLEQRMQGMEARLSELDRNLQASLESIRRSQNEEIKSFFVENRAQSDRLSSVLSETNEAVRKQMELFFRESREQGERLSSTLDANLQELNRSFSDRMEAFLKESRNLNQALGTQQKEISGSLVSALDRIRSENASSMEAFREKTEKLSSSVREDMERIRRENSEQLEKMRSTVDEKLMKTLDERLTRSFEAVTSNLESLYKSLGEMNNLAKDVSNLNRMFSNIKSRGTWGEVQAETILSDILSPSQYVKNYSPRSSDSNGFVEFAIRLPGKGTGEVFLPIDSKFPKEDFARYSEAVECGNQEAIDSALKSLRNRVLSEARDIRNKYIMPPKTTDFAILFVPTEGLYAELLRMEGFVETLQVQYHVVATGPTNFAALINSLQMGFRTMQVEKNTKKVWDLFAALKKQFSAFSEELDATRRSLESATSKVDKAVKRSGMITGRLERIELPDEVEQNGENSTLVLE